MEVRGMAVSTPDLEDLFMAYYEADPADPAPRAPAAPTDAAPRAAGRDGAP
jgi:hypothetical protein